MRSPDGSAELIDYFDSMPGKGLPGSAFGAGGNPQSVTLKYGAGVHSIIGGASVAVPGSLRGWEAAPGTPRQADAPGGARARRPARP